MNARDIPECMASYGRLATDVAYMTGYTVSELVAVHARLVAETDYDAYLNVSDDCVVTQEAVDAVTALLEQGHPAVTGWCRLRKGTTAVNLTRRAFECPSDANPPKDDFDFYQHSEVKRWPEPAVPTGFMGMALTGLTKEGWQEFPYGCWHIVHDRGHGSDTHLSLRLRDAGVPMVAAREGYVEHLKARRQDPNSWRGKGAHRLLVGEVPQRVTIQTKRVLFEGGR